jgi:hypothetical protein
VESPHNEVVIGIDMAVRPKAAAIRLRPFEFVAGASFLSNPDEDSGRSLAREIRGFAQAHGALGAKTVLGVPLSHSTLLLTRIPPAKTAYLTKAIRWELRRLAPVTADLLRANWVEWPSFLPEPPGADPAEKGQLYLIAGADDAWVSRACKIARNAGLSLGVVEPCAGGACRAAWFARTGALSPQDSRFSVTVVVEEEGYLCYGFGPSVWGARHIVSRSESEVALASLIPGEILRAIRFVQGPGVQDIAITALGPELRCKEVQEAVRLRTQEETVLWVEASSKPVGEFAVAIGLAMRLSGRVIL